METAERIRLLVAPLAEAAEVDLYDVEFTEGVLRITVDQTGGVDMAAVHRLTRDISRLIDEQDPIPGHFTLEVSSPGLERALRTPEHFVRSIGARISLKTRAGVPGDRRATATLVSADADGITIEADGAEPGQTRTLAYDDLERVRTIFEWGPAPKPGGPKSTPSAKKNKAAKS